MSGGRDRLQTCPLVREGQGEEFVEAYHSVRPLDAELIIERIRATMLMPDLQQQAIAFVRRLAKG